jgi:hypothetical protein
MILVSPENIDDINDIDIKTKVNKSDTASIVKWQDWPAETIGSVNEICCNLMNKFNYEIHNK